MTFQEIYWIAKLYENGSITTTAEKLFITQPALSQCLARVENQLGFPLFIHTKKQLTPTKNAELFYEMAKSVEGAYHLFLSKVALSGQCALEEISIGVSPYLSAKIFAQLITELEMIHPEIKFSVYESTASNMIDAIQRNKTQLMINNIPEIPSGFVSHKIVDIPTVIYLRKNSDAAKHVEYRQGIPYLDPVYLQNEPLALTQEGQSSRKIAKLIFSQAGFDPTISYATSSIGMLFDYANAGLSSSVGPWLPDAERTSSSEVIICRIPEEYPQNSSTISIYTLPEIDKVIPDDIYSCISSIVRAAVL